MKICKEFDDDLAWHIGNNNIVIKYFYKIITILIYKYLYYFSRILYNSASMIFLLIILK